MMDTSCIRRNPIVFKYFIPLLLCATGMAFGSQPPTDGNNGAPAPGVLFHASFDADNHIDFEPMVHPHGHAHLGEEGRFPNADFALGNPLPSNVHRAQMVPEGKFGEALFVPKGGILTFEGMNNILAAQGTIAFWVRPEDPLFSHPYRGADHPKIINITDATTLGRANAFLEMAVNGPREHLRITGVGEVDAMREWQPEEWVHVAITWDETQGRRYYEDGQLIASDDTLRHRFPAVDKINLGSWVFIAWRSGARFTGFFYDDLYLFDYPLNGEQVAALAESGQPPMAPDNRVQADDGQWQRWFEVVFQADDPSIPVLGAEGLTMAWQQVDRILSHYSTERVTATVDSRKSMNGSSNTASNGEFLEFDFAPGSTFNFVRAQGSFEGILEAGNHGWPMKTSEGMVRQRVDSPIATAKATLDLTSGEVSHIDFIKLSSGAKPGVESNSVTGGDFSIPRESPGSSVDSRIDAYFAPGSRATALVNWQNRGERDGVVLDRTFHVVLNEVGRDTVIRGLVFELDLGPVQQDAVLNLRLFDPVRFTRYLAEVDVKIEASALPRKLVLRLEGLDFLVRETDPVWLALTPSRPVEIHVGEGASSMVLLGGDEEARSRYVRNMERMISDIFMDLSQPQPWRVAAEETHPYKQMLGVAKLYDYCDYLRHFEPENRLANAVKSWSLTRSDRWLPEARREHPDPLADMRVELDEGDAPLWAALGRGALQANREIIDWWLDNRLDPETGMLGGGVGDDTTFMPWLVNIALISDPDHRYRDAVRSLADYTWENTLDRGLNIRMTDHLHAYEEGANVQHLLPRLFYGEPESIRRLLLTSQFYDGHLTAINPQGLRLARSANFNAETARAPEGSAWHSTRDLGQSMIYMPGRILTWYNGHPEVTRVLTEWIDAWLSYADWDADSLTGFIGAGGIDFYTGERSGRLVPGETWHHIYWAADVTGDPDYLKPGYLINERGGSTGHWIEWRLLAAEIDPDGLGLGEESAAREAFRQQQARLPEHLERDILFVKKYLPVQTVVGQSTDRIRVPQNAVAEMFLGGLATIGKRLPYLYNAVSWENADDDIVRYVIDKSRRSLTVKIYSYHPDPQEIILRPWQLIPGKYRIRTGVDRVDGGHADTDVSEHLQELWRYEAVPLTVPPQQVFVVEIELEQAFHWDLHDLPDLGIGPTDVEWSESELTLTLHNLGSVDAPPSAVALMRGDREIDRQKLPAIPAPIDLEPSVRQVHFPLPEQPGEVSVVVNPDGDFREITRVNNVLPLAEIIE